MADIRGERILPAVKDLETDKALQKMCFVIFADIIFLTKLLQRHDKEKAMKECGRKPEGRGGAGERIGRIYCEAQEGRIAAISPVHTSCECECEANLT